MEELAAVYCEEKMFDEAKLALCTPFVGTNKQDTAVYYFTWSLYYERTGNADSAIFYNKKGMMYGLKERNIEASLDLARIYARLGNIQAMKDYYELHVRYEDSLSAENVVEYGDYIAYVEENTSNERKKVELLEVRLWLTVIIFVILLIVAVAAMSLYRWYKKKKECYEEQRERAKTYWEKSHADDMESIWQLEQEIQSLKEELHSSDDSRVELQRRLKKAEAVLAEKNEQIRSEQKEIECKIIEFERSEVYQKFCDVAFTPHNEDFRMLENALNETYNRFLFRLKELCPIIQTDELQICCLVKIGLKSKEICNKMHFSTNVLSMKRLRLYQKFFNKKGSVTEFDTFIREF